MNTSMQSRNLPIRPSSREWFTELGPLVYNPQPSTVRIIISENDIKELKELKQ
jgi:hypothetical protein